MNSVCIAAYNGELYIKKQVVSILEQLNTNDELIIIDDNSSDSTINIINDIKDNRIKLYINKLNLGHVKTFEKAITLANGDYIFLSDQDDYWLPNRLNININLLKNSNSLLMISNMNETLVQGLFDSSIKSIMPKSNYIANLLNLIFSKSLYFGSLMCFKKELKLYILPFPKFVNAHDIYIALVANSVSTILHHDEVLLLRTNTGNNLTYRKRTIFKKIGNRILLFFNIIYSFKYFKFE